MAKATSDQKGLELLPIHTCPFVEWYQFKRCEIKTCKNYTSVTESRCLDIDRVKPSGSKFISDAELHLFKFDGTGVTTRLVSLKRKKAVDRVKSIIILYKYIEFIRTKYESQGENSPLVMGRYAQAAQKTDPLKIRKLNWKNWMWHYLVDPDVHAEFLEQHGGECKEFKIEQLLRLTNIKYTKLLKEIEEAK